MGKEKSVKRTMRQHRFFSEEFKIQKVKEIEQNQIGISELSCLYNVSRSAVYKWVFKYSLHLKKGVNQVIEMESESHKTKKLQERLAELERAIGQKQLKIDYLEKVIEFSSEELGEDIKKKFDTESSDGLMKQEGATL